MSITFPPAILGLEMASPWAPGIFGLFLLKKPHAHKIPRFGGGLRFFGKGGGSPNLFLWAWMEIFPIDRSAANVLVVWLVLCPFVV